MKKFTLMLIAALIAVFTQAAPPADVLGKANLNPVRTTATPVLLNAKQAPAKMKQAQIAKKARAPRKAAASATELAGSYLWEYSTTSSRSEDLSAITDATAGSANVTITATDATNITISGMFTNDIVGTYDATEGYITVARGQLAGTSSYGDYVINGLFYYAGDDENQAGWYYSDIYIGVQDNGQLVVQDWLVRVLTGGTYDGYSLTPYYVAQSTLTPSEAPQLVELPAGVELKEYTMSYSDYNGNATSSAAFVGVDGNDVYLKGFSSYLPNALIKGTKDGNTVTFAANQWLGSYGSYQSYFVEKAVFTYDEAANTYSATGDVYSLLDNYYIDVWATNPVLKGVVEKAAIPANPAITNLQNGNYGYYITFSVPNVDVDGDGLVSSKLFYQFYTDIEHEVAPLTFTPTTHTRLTEDLTEIPFGFTENYDFYDTQIYLNELYSSSWNKIGIKSIYRGGGEVNETEIQWYTIKAYALDQARTNLNNAITAAQNQLSDETNTKGVAALTAALEAAQAVAANADATLEELTEAATALQTATTTFRNLNTANKTLGTEIAAAETLLNDETKLNGKDALQAAINSAKAVYESADGTVDEVNAAITALQEAVAAFKAANGEGEAQWVASQQGYSNAQVVTEFTIDENLSAAVSKGTGSTDPAYYNQGTALRLYSGNTLTITGGEDVVSIDKIVLTTASGSNSGSTITVDAGQYAFSGTKGTWTADAETAATAVTFTRPGTSGHARITTIDVYYTTVVNTEEPVVSFNYEAIAITPAEGQVESLENFDITFGGQVVTINEDAVITLTANDEVVVEGGIELDEDGTLHVGLADRISAPGNYQLNIPAGAIKFNGEDILPLAFRYNILGPDYTIDPAEGEVESLSTFAITFNNFFVTVNDEASAILFNTETEEEVAGDVYETNGGKGAYIVLENEVTAPGSYQLIILDGSLQKTIDDSFLPELAFDYTIAAGEEPQPTVSTATYAVQVGETHTAGETVNVTDEEGAVVATLTFGFEGGADFGAGKSHSANADLGLVAFTEGNGENGKADSGTTYIIAPKYDGDITVGVVLNANKAFYVLENDEALEDYNGITVADKYYGAYNFPVKANNVYKVYCAGSKLGFYGFQYNYTGATVGISNVSTVVENGAVYNLRGQKVTNPTKGLYIINGKKVVIK